MVSSSHSSSPEAPDEVTYNTLLKGLCDSGKMDKALEVFDGMKVSPDEVTYSRAKKITSIVDKSNSKDVSVHTLTEVGLVPWLGDIGGPWFTFAGLVQGASQSTTTFNARTHCIINISKTRMTMLPHDLILIVEASEAAVKYSVWRIRMS
ncbi:hypothetical protein AKJ16_DCAP00729 [Drosera capensis]